MVVKAKTVAARTSLVWNCGFVPLVLLVAVTFLRKSQYTPSPGKAGFVLSLKKIFYMLTKIVKVYLEDASEIPVPQKGRKQQFHHLMNAIS